MAKNPMDRPKAKTNETIDGLISLLQEIRATHGNIPVAVRAQNDVEQLIDPDAQIITVGGEDWLLFDNEEIAGLRD